MAVLQAEQLAALKGSTTQTCKEPPATPVAPVQSRAPAPQPVGEAAPTAPLDVAPAAGARAALREPGAGLHGRHAREPRTGNKVSSLAESKAAARFETELKAQQQRKSTRDRSLAAARSDIEDSDGESGAGTHSQS